MRRVSLALYFDPGKGVLNFSQIIRSQRYAGRSEVLPKAM
jgi:hypothetical protein